jgi:ubiquinol-cytochrome c reductase cytochrome c1 subunit
MLRKFSRSAVLATAVLGLAAPVLAAGDYKHPIHHHWHHEGVFGTFDKAQLQRGFQVYREVCSSCHGLKFVAFRTLGQKGAPFFDEEFPNPNDNPVIKALSAEYTITDGPDEVGDMYERPGRPSDFLPSPYPNEQAARAGNGGAYPPDLSVITKARHYGANYIYSLMRGYYEAPADFDVAPGLYYNPYFPGREIAMAPQLNEGRLDFAEGQPIATTEQMAEDVTAFLQWASDPHQIARKRMGFGVIIFLTIFAGLLYMSYKQIWRNVKH